MLPGRSRQRNSQDCKYTKISFKVKMMLLTKVLCENQEIKQAAKTLHLNYSTAKTLMRKYKPKALKFEPNMLASINRWYTNYEAGLERCGYAIIGSFKQTFAFGEVKLEQISKEEGGSQYIPEELEGSGGQSVELVQQILFKD